MRGLCVGSLPAEPTCAGLSWFALLRDGALRGMAKITGPTSKGTTSPCTTQLTCIRFQMLSRALQVPLVLRPCCRCPACLPRCFVHRCCFAPGFASTGGWRTPCPCKPLTAVWMAHHHTLRPLPPTAVAARAGRAAGRSEAAHDRMTVAGRPGRRHRRGGGASLDAAWSQPAAWQRRGCGALAQAHPTSGAAAPAGEVACLWDQQQWWQQQQQQQLAAAASTGLLAPAATLLAAAAGAMLLPPAPPRPLLASLSAVLPHPAAAALAALQAGAAALARHLGAALVAHPWLGIVAAALGCVALSVAGVAAAWALGLVRRPAFSYFMREAEGGMAGSSVRAESACGADDEEDEEEGWPVPAGEW
ncbi:hypothetical protein ABPG75_003655 [Micractinium tetrahymenae]